MISSHAFDAVIFCLMLDYLPTCRQRLSACLIGHDLLACLGLLLIVEPDSSLRENRQSSWRQALQSIGFALVTSVKMSNLHCLAFRKLTAAASVDEDEYERIARLLHIPQDTIRQESSVQPSTSVDHDLFNELPLADE